jgi:hypothetical protein
MTALLRIATGCLILGSLRSFARTDSSLYIIREPQGARQIQTRKRQ